MPKEITLENLADMIQGGFEEVDGKFEKMDRKMDNGFDEIKLKLDNVAYRFELVELERRVKLLEQKLSAS